MLSMRCAFFYTILFFSLFCKAQNFEKELGIGLLTVNTQHTLPLYKHPNDLYPTDSIVYQKDKKGTLMLKLSSPIAPYKFFPGADLGMVGVMGTNEQVRGIVSPVLIFRVLSEGKDFYQIVIDEHRGNSFFIKKNKKAEYYVYDKKSSTYEDDFIKPKTTFWFRFENWLHYLSKCELLTFNGQMKLYDTPNGKCIVDKEHHGVISLIDCRDNWIEIETEVIYLNGVQLPIYKGWLKWYDKGKEQITIMVNALY